MTMEGILWIVILGVFFYFMIKHGGGCCGGHRHGEHESGGQGNSGDERHHDHQHSDGMKIEGSNNVNEKDPVCGMQLLDHSISGSHLGRTFHFCSEQCRKIFTLNPNKYVRT